jgi:hypothetical protein
VSLHVTDLTAHSALNLLLEPLALELIVTRGMLHVTTEVAAGEEIFTVVYIIRDLETAGIATDLLPDIIEEVTLGPWSNVEGTGGSVEVPVPGILLARNTHRPHEEVAMLLDDLRTRVAERQQKNEPPEPQPDPRHVVTRFYRISGEDRAAKLENVIPTVIAPETWDAGGGAGVIRRVNDTLVVRQTRQVQAQIQEFLDDLVRAGMAPTQF